MSHQVKAGRGAMYQHTLGRPEYLDSMEKPYAVFVFKYRSKGKDPWSFQGGLCVIPLTMFSQDMLKKMFGSVIKEEKDDWQKRMMTLPKEEVIEMLRVAKVCSNREDLRLKSHLNRFY